jgi:hypothetical protein
MLFVSAAVAAAAIAATVVSAVAEMDQRVTNHFFHLSGVDMQWLSCPHIVNLTICHASNCSKSTCRSSPHYSTLKPSSCYFGCYSSNVSDAMFLKQPMQLALVQCKNT